MIECRGVSFSYDGAAPALDGIDLNIEDGEFFCILGGNGSGKSTFAKHLNALLRPDTGTVRVNGMDASDPELVYDIRSTAGMVFQNPDDQLVATLVEDDVAFGPENLGVESAQIAQRVRDVLKAVGLVGFERHETHALSGGQKQRVALAGVTDAAARDAATFGVCLGAIQAGANIVRVHDVAGFAQFLNGYWAVAKPQPRRAFVAVGSNLGHRCDNIRAARDMIAEIPLTCVSNCSRIYESEPAYETRQDAFANAVIEIKTELAPLVLLDELMKIEAELGRDRSKKAKANGPRTIDLDLLWMDGETHGGKKLRLPHPLIGERDFVLVPLEDLMHDPARFFRYNGVEVKEPEDRVGHIVGELGRM